MTSPCWYQEIGIRFHVPLNPACNFLFLVMIKHSYSVVVYLEMGGRMDHRHQDSRPWFLLIPHREFSTPCPASLFALPEYKAKVFAPYSCHRFLLFLLGGPTRQSPPLMSWHRSPRQNYGRAPSPFTMPRLFQKLKDMTTSHPWCPLPHWSVAARATVVVDSFRQSWVVWVGGLIKLLIQHH
ncbi:hypothetical protein D5086_031541 [Populus alba]|uniref:Uncharacterized protein n=1 Tax=Populus alba TaxID=43335 RepID=A0ACC4AIZ0_POPAL